MDDSLDKWFAIKTRQEQRAERELTPLCSEVFFPLRHDGASDSQHRIRPLIPNVLFINTTPENALSLESAGRKAPEASVPFWIYRYPDNDAIQTIPERQIRLLKLLNSADTAGCEVYNRQDFTAGQLVRITGGPFRGYEGHVVRVRKNKHVVVRLEGVCCLMLPFIHPDLLQPLS